MTQGVVCVGRSLQGFLRIAHGCTEQVEGRCSRGFALAGRRIVEAFGGGRVFADRAEKKNTGRHGGPCCGAVWLPARRWGQYGRGGRG